MTCNSCKFISTSNKASGHPTDGFWTSLRHVHTARKNERTPGLIGLLLCQKVIKLAVLCKSPSLILLWSLSLWLLVRNTGLTPIVRSYRQNSKHNCRLLCERDILRLASVEKMGLSIQKTVSVNVAFESNSKREWFFLWKSFVFFDKFVAVTCFIREDSKCTFLSLAVLPDWMDDFQPKSSLKPTHPNKIPPKTLTVKIM